MRPPAWKIWWTAARPKTLSASICPVLIGTSLAEREQAAWWPAAAVAMIGAVAIQVGTNYANDYFDYFQGADTERRKGPTRAVQAGWVTPSAMRNAFLLAFAGLAICCVYLVSRAGWPLAVLGMISALCGIGYTASRFSLAYLGLGDLFVLVFFGPVAVAGTHYVQTLRLSSAAAVAGLAPGLIAVAILVVNNLRDIHEDAAAQKRTLAVRFGASFARWEFALCLLAAASVPVVLWHFYAFRHIILLAELPFILAVPLIGLLFRRDGRTLNPLLAMTGGLLMLYTAAFVWVCRWA